jgi:hypothetical protein
MTILTASSLNCRSYFARFLSESMQFLLYGRYWLFYLSTNWGKVQRRDARNEIFDLKYIFKDYIFY